MATIVDVAKRAGVAVTTVSRVLNNKGQVSAATRDRVLTAMQELSYRPSPAARSLPRRRVHGVSIVVPFVTHPSAVARVQGDESRAAPEGFDIDCQFFFCSLHQGEFIGITANG